MHADAKRIEENLRALNNYNATPENGVTRLTYSPEHADARAYIMQQMQEAGLTVHEDALGNITGRREGSGAGLPAIAAGSHFDTVRNGGMFDGNAGVVAGLEVARMLQAANAQLAHPFEVIATVEEEGGRFSSGMLGGRVIAGLVAPEDLDKLKDTDGVTIREAGTAFGLQPDALPQAKRSRENLMAFLELHIEQGPVLENKQVPVGIVDAIVGISVKEYTITGRPDHAGTTPMALRKDAMVAAAHVITAINQAVKALNDGTVSTVGIVQVQPSAVNVVPGQVTFSAEIRSGSEESIARMEQQTLAALQEATAPYGMEFTQTRVFETKPVHMAAQILGCMENAAEKCGIPTIRMQSGAGHDAMFISQATDVGMLFVPSKAGRSHSKDEWTDFSDIAKGTELLYEAVCGLDAL